MVLISIKKYVSRRLAWLNRGFLFFFLFCSYSIEVTYASFEEESKFSELDFPLGLDENINAQNFFFKVASKPVHKKMLAKKPISQSESCNPKEKMHEKMPIEGCAAFSKFADLRIRGLTQVKEEYNECYIKKANSTDDRYFPYQTRPSPFVPCRTSKALPGSVTCHSCQVRVETKIGGMVDKSLLVSPQKQERTKVCEKVKILHKGLALYPLPEKKKVVTKEEVYMSAAKSLLSLQYNLASKRRKLERTTYISSLKQKWIDSDTIFIARKNLSFFDSQAKETIDTIKEVSAFDDKDPSLMFLAGCFLGAKKRFLEEKLKFVALLEALKIRPEMEPL